MSINPTRVKVLGVGGGGCNAVNRMILDGIQNVDVYAVNTDIQHLQTLQVPNKIQIGEKLTRGLGAGAKPEIGEQAAQEDADRMREILKETDMLFIAAGLGGGTGTGAAPVIAEIAKELGILTVAIVTKPFNFEGNRKMQIAAQGLEKLKDKVDTYIVINNQRLTEIEEKNFTIGNAFKMVDDILSISVRSITDVLTTPAIINVDFSDMRTVMEKGGLALIGLGEASDSKKDLAFERAITSPLLEGNTISGAKKLLLTFWLSEDVPFKDMESVFARVQEQVNQDALILFGVSMEKGRENFMRITIVATDFENQQKVKKPDPPTKPQSPSPTIQPVFPDDETPAYVRRKKII
ncbi:MAG: cell division protein FtsZ [Aquificaceae bacterium]|nr:cell division protein FtsZ [Aquificaceae bacterium]MDW8237170.1 cell division protein FtsZ [Aquificaceae bacterium]